MLLSNGARERPVMTLSDWNSKSLAWDEFQLQLREAAVGWKEPRLVVILPLSEMERESAKRLCDAIADLNHIPAIPADEIPPMPWRDSQDK